MKDDLRVATFWDSPTSTKAAIVKDDGLIELPFSDVAALLQVGESWREVAENTKGEVHPMDKVHFAPTIINPSKIICLGYNYATHAVEMENNKPEYPIIFTKFGDTLAGPYDEIELPPSSRKVDWEVELCAVMGKQARNVAAKDARKYIGGFVVANDVSMRDYQFRTSQFTQGKIFDRSTPIGPWMVTPEVVGFGQDLEIKCLVNGEEMQKARTSQMIFGIEFMIEYLSTIITLRPGDLLLTGTPEGVGNARKPPEYINPGDTVTSSIEGIGDLMNLFT